MKIPARLFVLRILGTHRLLVARFIVTAVGRAAASMAVILLIREFLSGVLGEGGGLAGWATANFGTTLTLWAVAGLMVGCYLCGSLLNYDNQVSQQRIIKIVELGLMERLIRHLLSLSVPFFDRQSHGDIIQAVRQDVTQLRIVIISLANLLLEGALAVALLAAAVWLSPTLTLWALVVLPAALFPIFIIARRTLRHSYRVRRAGYVLFDVILQILRGIRVIKVYAGEEAEAQGAVEKGRRYFDELVEMVRVRSLARVVLESMAGLSVVVVVVVGGLEVMGGELTWPALLAFLMAVRALHGPLHNINSRYIDIQNYGASVQRIGALLDTRPEITDRRTAIALDRPPACITFDAVSFSYGASAVLTDISFELKSGETLGIAGPSGVGKTTLLNLVARFYDPTEGRILFDGRDLREYRVADVYAKVAIVTQTPFLFATTVRENIRVGRPSASDAEVEAAARAADVHEEIMTLEEGYLTVLGVGGRALSVGQAQRINVARAILKNAPILLLDEATSSLDSLAESRVQRAIQRLMVGRTTFIVAHRLSTLRRAHRILVLDGGRMAGTGPHEDLIESCELYRRMWQTQLLDESRSGIAEAEVPVLDLFGTLTDDAESLPYSASDSDDH